jgi:hypothetical protein
MRIAKIVGLGTLAAVLLVSCGWFGGLLGGNTGLVTFYSGPTYNAGTEQVEFRTAIQFSDSAGQATEIEYQLLDGTTVVSSGTTQADEFDDVLLLWKSATVTVPVSQATYSDKTITVFLDPDGSVSSDTGFTTEADRQKTVSIP